MLVCLAHLKMNKIKFNFVSVNKDYLIISNNKREHIKVKLTNNQLIRLNKEISNVIWERNNDV